MQSRLEKENFWESKNKTLIKLEPELALTAVGKSSIFEEIVRMADEVDPHVPH